MLLVHRAHHSTCRSSNVKPATQTAAHMVRQEATQSYADSYVQKSTLYENRTGPKLTVYEQNKEMAWPVF